MSWIPVNTIDLIYPTHQTRGEQYVEEMGAHFSDEERLCLKRLVKQVSFVSTRFMKEVSPRSGGFYNRVNELVVVASGAQHDIALQRVGTPELFTLAHEMSHPLYLLAGKVGHGGFLIINPDVRRTAQEKARTKFPRAIAAIDEALESWEKITQLKPDDFTPQEILAMRTYMVLDERYYDLFGSSIRAKAGLGGYTAPNRNHEIACNLRALKICEADILSAGLKKDTASEGIVEDIAGDIFRSLEMKFTQANRRYPDHTFRQEGKSSGQASSA